MLTEWMLPVRTRKFAIVTLVVLAAITGVIIYMMTRPAPEPRPSDVVMVLTQRGGLCQPGKPCEASYRVFGDGRFERHENFSAGDIAQLKDIIQRTDFTAYGPNPEPQCPSFTDGVDLVLSSPLKHPGKQFTLCTLDIPENDQGLRAIVRLLDKQ